MYTSNVISRTAQLTVHVFELARRWKLHERYFISCFSPYRPRSRGFGYNLLTDCSGLHNVSRLCVLAWQSWGCSQLCRRIFADQENNGVIQAHNPSMPRKILTGSLLTILWQSCYGATADFPGTDADIHVSPPKRCHFLPSRRYWFVLVHKLTVNLEPGAAQWKWISMTRWTRLVQTSSHRHQNALICCHILNNKPLLSLSRIRVSKLTSTRRSQLAHCNVHGTFRSDECISSFW